MSSPARNPQFPVERAGGAATLGKSVTIKGQIVGREDLTIDGEVEGSIELKDHRLTVGATGNVRAGVKAREVVVQGKLNGKVEAGDKIEIRSNATLIGDVQTARIVIEDGAYFKGAVDIIKKTVPGTPAPAVVGAG